MSYHSMLTETVTVRDIVGRDNNGDPEYGAPYTLCAYVQRVSEKVVTGEGNEVVSSHRVFTEREIGDHSRVWIPGVDPNEEALGLRPLSIEVTPHPWGCYKTVEIKLGQQQ